MADSRLVEKLQPHIEKIAKLYVQDNWTLKGVLDYVQEQCSIQTSLVIHIFSLPICPPADHLRASNLKRYFNLHNIKKPSAEEELKVLAQNLLWHDAHKQSVTMMKWNEVIPDALVRDFLRRHADIQAKKAILPWHLSIVTRKVDDDHAREVNLNQEKPDRRAQQSASLSLKRGIDGLHRNRIETSPHRGESRAPKMGLGPLHYAAERNHVVLVQQMFRMGANVNDLGLDGSTPLIHASLRGSLDVLRVLLKQPDVDVHVCDKKGRTALMAAVANGHSGCALLLIEHEADVDVIVTQGQTLLHVACRQKEMECVIDKILQVRKRMVNKTTRDGDTAIHTALLYGNEDYARLLMKAGADPNVPNRYGDTPMHHACRSATEDLILDMIKPTSVHERGDEIVLHLLCERGLTRPAEAFIMTFDVAIDGRVSFCTPLLIAAAEGHYDTVQMLLDHGADPRITDLDLDTPLSVAIKEGHIAVAQLLIQRGSPVDASRIINPSLGYHMVSWSQTDGGSYHARTAKTARTIATIESKGTEASKNTEASKCTEASKGTFSDLSDVNSFAAIGAHIHIG